MINLAIEVAAKAHKGQTRKGTDIPYITHPYTVGMMLLQEGCSEELVIAGILHDTVEDTYITLDYIREMFGKKVADIVEGCSEPDKSLPWEDRKEHTIEYLKTAPLDIRIVTLADKLHNIRSTIKEYEKVGEEVWNRFRRGKEKQSWYYYGLIDVLCNREDIPNHINLFNEFEKEVKKLFEF
ncbi:HD domain-containing protein [Caldisalinibacter kiritimatiensis]|uniref:Guanosine-3',5'-bis(Diphosphate) 3'-pyrophosphohydrolase n=1 Tax=Caldisalinibacter kiritimatiensis TaxID=1304284 RepID=R1CHP4_9FIRM|nr:HD domain-containing protein [Caldisalinibacter kiritimatiensis]EOD01815.1 Guanosine-3',5'-bis(diphosphate) 3'- pyrophosphohydrolase [Caldisalinibacter kiritimatiensis]